MGKHSATASSLRDFGMAASTLTFVNHASILVEDPTTRVLCDPWFRGAAFNDGWDLLSPMVLDPLADPDGPHFPTHIWLSHEHPDHFSVPTLKRVPADARARVTILFQRTTDGRVAAFCRAHGFPVTEIDDRETVVLSPTTRLTVLRNGTEDSALHLVSGDRTYLDLNDCMFESHAELRRLLGDLSPPDVLLSQFSYAEGIGGPGDTARRKASARYYLDRFFEAADLFPDAIAVPFAGFKRFSHVENEHHNDGFPLDELLAESRTRPGRVALLYPGDVLGPESLTDAALESAGARYRRDIERPVEMHQPGASVSLDELVAAGAAYRERVTAVHGRRALALLARAPDPIGLRTTPIALWDQNVVVDVSLDAGLQRASTATAAERADAGMLSMHSESLRVWLEQDFGASTVLISGRFTASDAMTSRLYRWAHLGLMTAANERLSIRYALSSAGRVVRTLLRRRSA